VNEFVRRTSWELLPAISFNDNEVDRVLRCGIYHSLFLSLPLFLFLSSLILPSIRRISTTKSVANEAIGRIPGCKDNSYDSSGDIFYIDAIIDVKGICLSILTGHRADSSASDAFLNLLSLRFARLIPAIAVSNPARGTIIDSFILDRENCPLFFSP